MFTPIVIGTFAGIVLACLITIAINSGRIVNKLSELIHEIKMLRSRG